MYQECIRSIRGLIKAQQRHLIRDNFTIHHQLALERIKTSQVWASFNFWIGSEKNRLVAEGILRKTGRIVETRNCENFSKFTFSRMRLCHSEANLRNKERGKNRWVLITACQIPFRYQRSKILFSSALSLQNMKYWIGLWKWAWKVIIIWFSSLLSLLRDGYRCRVAKIICELWAAFATWEKNLGRECSETFWHFLSDMKQSYRVVKVQKHKSKALQKNYLHNFKL